MTPSSATPKFVTLPEIRRAGRESWSPPAALPDQRIDRSQIARDLPVGTYLLGERHVDRVLVDIYPDAGVILLRGAGETPLKVESAVPA